MASVTMKELLEAGVHFGHQVRRWNPKMSPYLFGVRNGIHIVDLDQTATYLKRALNFVSNAVMTGFTTGIAVQIIAGVIFDATGYKTQSHNTIRKFIEAFANVGSWQSAPCLVALATVAVWAVFHLVKRLSAFATLIALVVVTVAVTALHVDVETVGDIASIPNALPPFVLPNFDVIPGLLGGGLAVALVGLAQAAGISAAVPNPDGSRPNTSRDFTAQGVANLAGVPETGCLVDIGYPKFKGGLGGYARYIAICPPDAPHGQRISNADAPLAKRSKVLHWDAAKGYRVR